MQEDERSANANDCVVPGCRARREIYSATCSTCRENSREDKPARENIEGLSRRNGLVLYCGFYGPPFPPFAARLDYESKDLSAEAKNSLSGLKHVSYRRNGGEPSTLCFSVPSRRRVRRKQSSIDSFVQILGNNNDNDLK